MDEMTCGFNIGGDFTEAMDSSENTGDLPCVGWGQMSRDCVLGDAEDLDIDGWRTPKPESQSLRLHPSDKVKKRRRTYLLRFYAHHESAQETRSESYAFVHHGNWRQYMKQYRKYHTVGQAGRVNYEDLEWKSLLRHINIGETLKELLFNSSASLHPVPNFPSQQHWYRGTSLNTALPQCVAPSAADTTGGRKSPKKTPKRNLFQSFNLASVKHRKPKPSSLWMSSSERRKTKEKRAFYGELQPERSSASSAKSERPPMHSGRIVKLLTEDAKDDSSAKSAEKLGVSKKDKKVRKSKNETAELQLSRQPSGPKSRDFISHVGVGGPGTGVQVQSGYIKGPRDSSAEVLEGVRRSHGDRFDGLQFTLFKADGLGSLRLRNSEREESRNGNHDQKAVDKAIRQRLEQTGRAVRKEFKRKLPSMKLKPERPSPAQGLADDPRQNFAVINYGSLQKHDQMKTSQSVQEMNRDITYDTRCRFAEPLPVQTVILGNKYATAEEHKARLRAISDIM